MGRAQNLAQDIYQYLMIFGQMFIDCSCSLRIESLSPASVFQIWGGDDMKQTCDFCLGNV